MGASQQKENTHRPGHAKAERLPTHGHRRSQTKGNTAAPELMAVGGKGWHHSDALVRYWSSGWSQFCMQSLQRPVVARHHIRHIAPLDLADRGLGNPGSLGHLRLSQAMGSDGGNVVFGFHLNIPLRLF
jgi:hypothetical protein